MRIFVFGLFCVGFCLAGIDLQAQDVKSPQMAGFLSTESEDFRVFYEPDVSLARVYKKISRRRFYVSPKRDFALTNFKEKVTYRMEVLFNKVKETLGMYPVVARFNIKIFKHRRSVYDEYFRITRSRQRVKSFYLHSARTIYASEDDISDSILAHEMAHVIIDHYFIISPPDKVKEMLAVYVDSHLQD